MFHPRVRWTHVLSATVVVAFSLVASVAGPASALPVGFLKETTGAFPSVAQQYFTSNVDAMSCTTTTSCTVVGQYLSSGPNGTSHETGFAASEVNSTWGAATVLGVPVPLVGSQAFAADATDVASYLFALSCSDADDCTAVGAAESQDSVEPEVESEVNGQWQTPLAIAPPYADSSFSSLDEVSCSSSQNCVAVGSFQTAGDTESIPFYLSESSGVWSSATILPLPADIVFDSSASVSALTCSSATSCLVFGTYQQSTGLALFEEPFTSGSFGSPASVALPSGETEGSVTSLWCEDASNCVGVGDAGSSGVAHGLAITETAGTWSAVATDANAGSTRLNYVTCTNVTTCTAIGEADISNAVTVVEYSENAGVWTQGATGTANTTPVAASCVDTVCEIAVSGLSEPQHAVIEDLSGATYSSPVTITMPSDIYIPLDGAFIDTSCPSTTTCEVFGYLDNQQHEYQAYVETYVDGVATASSALSLTAPISYGNDYFGSISCASVGNCAVVFGSQGYGQSLDVEVSGTWQAPTALLPGDQIDAVSCVTGLWCEAVGTNPEGTLVGDQYFPTGITMTYSDGSWSSISTNTAMSATYGVSCWSTGNCEAVGEGAKPLDAAGTELVDGTWQPTVLVQVPANQAGQSSWFNGVSCLSSGDCLAVGGFQSNYQWRPMTAVATGGAWSAAAFGGGLPANAAGSHFVPQFDAVDCVDSQDCVVTGVYTDTDGEAQTMVSEGPLASSSFTGSALTAPFSPGVSPTTEWSFDGGVGCLSASNCMLVGTYDVTQNNQTVTLPDVAMTGETPPAEPIKVSAVGLRGAVTVSWTAGSGGPSPSSFTATVGTKSCTTAALQCTVSGLSNDTSYNAYVTANSSSGSSAPSDAVTVEVVGLASAPVINTVVAGNNELTIYFTPSSTDNGGAISSYTVSLTGDGDTERIACSTAIPVCNVPAANGYLYSLSMVALNGAGASASSNVATGLPVGPPDPPINVKALAGNGQLRIEWTLGNDGGSPTLESTAYAGTSSCTTSATTCTITGLTNGEKYTVTVNSTNARGVGDVSQAVIGEPIATTPLGAPGPVRSLKATAGVGRITLTWKAPTKAGTGIATYTICEVSPVKACGTNIPSDRSAIWPVTKKEKFSLQVVAVDGETSTIKEISATPKR